METTAKVLETMRSAGLPFCYFKFRVKFEFTLRLQYLN